MLTINFILTKKQIPQIIRKKTKCWIYGQPINLQPANIFSMC